MVASTLAFDLDREDARRSISLTPLYKLIRGERNSIIQDFVTFLTAQVHRSLARGSWYLRCVQQDAWVYMHPF